MADTTFAAKDVLNSLLDDDIIDEGYVRTYPRTREVLPEAD